MASCVHTPPVFRGSAIDSSTRPRVEGVVEAISDRAWNTVGIKYGKGNGHSPRIKILDCLRDQFGGSRALVIRSNADCHAALVLREGCRVDRPIESSKERSSNNYKRGGPVKILWDGRPPCLDFEPTRHSHKGRLVGARPEEHQESLLSVVDEVREPQLQIRLQADRVWGHRANSRPPPGLAPTGNPKIHQTTVGRAWSRSTCALRPQR